MQVQVRESGGDCINLITLEPAVFMALIPRLSPRVMKVEAQCVANTP